MYLRKIALKNPLTDATDNYEVQRMTTNKMIRRKKGRCKNLIIVELEVKRYNPNIIFNISGNIKKRY